MSANDPFGRYLRTPEAARFLGLSPRTLEKHRTYGTGPTYRKLGGRIVYAPDDLKSLGRPWREAFHHRPGIRHGPSRQTARE